MPSKCGVSSCFVYNTNKEYKLFRIPAVRSRATATAREQMMQRRSLWITNCGLEDPPSPHVLICSRHFVSGQPARVDDVRNVDWVPTLNLKHGDDPGTSYGKGHGKINATPGPHVAIYPIPSRECDIGIPLPAGAVIETTAACCVLSCVNPHPEWVTNLPKDRELQQRWLMAIQIGTGQPAVITPGENKGVCNMHFAAQLVGSQAGATENGYREPTLFARDNVLMQVVCCRLCLTFDTADSMYNMKLNVRDGHSLQWMAKTYFGQFASAKEFAEEGFFCERCTVQIDMAHTFCLELSEKSRKFKWLMAKMANEKVEFSKKVTLAKVKQERFILPKPSTATERSIQQPLSIPADQTESIEPDSNQINEQMPKIESDSTTEETNIQVECDPGLYDSSSDGVFDPENTPNQAIKVEPPEFSGEEPCLAEPDPPYLTNPPPMTEQPQQLPFKCYLCQARLDCKTSLIHHLMMDHQDHKSLHCAECNESFERITVFNKHLGMHDPTKRLKCSICPLRFRKTSAKVKHEASRHGLNHPNQQAMVKDKTKKHQCSQCEKAFVYISELRRHEKFKHQGGVIARCEICDKTFASERNLTRHLKLHRGDEKPLSLTTRTTTEIRCNLCQVAYQKSKDMVTHLQQVHPEAEFQTYPCKHCDDIFFSPTSRANHNNIHSDIYACDLCGKRHYSKLMMQRHRQSKHAIPLDEDQYRDCPICGKRYIKGTDYLRHMRTHEKEKFECETCGKMFREREQLRIHERIHTHEKPMECVACGARFGSPASLCRHKKVCPKIERN